MSHYCQYHKIHEHGRPTSSPGNFVAYTKKNLTDKFIGQTIWLLSGEKQGDRTAYLLEYAFVVETIERQADGKTLIKGTHGYSPQRPAPVRLADWLLAIKARTRNFQNGLSAVPDEFIPEMATTLGWVNRPA